VTIQNFAFNPATLTVSVGTTITWTNLDSAPHTVTSDDNLFDSGTLNQGAPFSHTFTTPGTFAYHCNIHPSMTAQVVVQDTQSPPPPPPPGTKTIEQALDTDGDKIIGDLEILQALQYWIKQQIVPDTDQVIDDLTMLALLQKWIKGTPIQ
jgi:hypothetical protein